MLRAVQDLLINGEAQCFEDAEADEEGVEGAGVSIFRC
jgi:hypothetical protein